LASASARRAPGVEPVSSAAVTLSPPSSDWIVAKCWSASVSVGAISAACIPWSTARSIAAKATTVLPDPTSPISRRCMGRERAMSPWIASSARSWSPVGVKGRPSCSQRSVSGAGPSRAAAVSAAVAPRRRRSSGELKQQQLVEGQAPPPAGRIAVVRESGRRPAPPGRSASPSSTRRRAGSGSSTSRSAPACSRTIARICVEVIPSEAG
jgi:hypothetical protein